MEFNFEDLVGPTLINGKGEEMPSSEALQGKKYVMLYFSAHWCPPCRGFTPYLKGAYTAHKEYLETLTQSKDDDGDNQKQEKQGEEVDTEEVEVVFISLDSVQDEYHKYLSTMPWLSVPFPNLWQLRIKDKLSEKYGVKSIPKLLVLNGKDGTLITRNGQGEYGRFFKGEYDVPSSWCVVS